MSATSVSAVENYIRAEKPSLFSEIAREILLDQREKERERGRRGGRSKAKEDRGKNRMVE